MSTRGRDSETDYHKMVGGKDDISHFIKRVQFKLHETYPQSQRNVDKPPFQVTETGWGEFDIQIKIYFVPEANEKPLTTFHRLKLHPWHPVAVAASSEAVMDDSQMDTSLQAGNAVDAVGNETTNSADHRLEESGSNNEEDDATQKDDPVIDDHSEQAKGTAHAEVKLEDAPGAAIVHVTRGASAAAAMPAQRHLPAVVHSWAFDEIVFPEPLEPFYDILIANPPTPLPAQSAQAYADPSAFERYRESLAKLNAGSGPEGRDINTESGIIRPHPLFDSSGAVFDALSREAILAEGERLDKARSNAVAELESSRNKLIDCEARLRQGRPRQTLATAATAPIA
jgi:YEATS domain-containing protein 4